MSSVLLSFKSSRTKIAVGAVLATGALLCTPLMGVSAANPRPAATFDARHNPRVMPTVVLLHGAWADSGAWDGVVQRLQHDGYPVIAPPNALRGLAIDSAYLSDLLQTISGPIVLVGHSYGGAVISDAAVGNPDVEALVYIDAFIPKKGESVETLAGQRPGSCLSGGGDPSKVFNLCPTPVHKAVTSTSTRRLLPTTRTPGSRSASPTICPRESARLWPRPSGRSPCSG